MKHYMSLAVAIGATALSACATTFKPVPDGYQGPTAILKDSSQVAAGDKCGNFFFLYDYNGKEVDNAMQASARDNAGSGPIFRVVKAFSRPLPARTATVFIAGRTHCAAPIMEMVGTVRLVGGKVEFTPEANAVYVVKGELAEDHSAVWIEDERNNLQVSNKLLIKGPAPAGFFGIKGKVEEIPPPR